MYCLIGAHKKNEENAFNFYYYFHECVGIYVHRRCVNMIEYYMARIEETEWAIFEAKPNFSDKKLNQRVWASDKQLAKD